MAIPTDILVVGGGPAGSTLARMLAASGREAVIIDKASFPRPKACGGGVPPRTVDCLGLDLAPVASGTVTSVALAGAWFGKPHVFALDRPSLVVNRAVFDAFLLAQARAAGCRVIENVPLRRLERNGEAYRIEAGDDTIQARVVCACDGVFSPTARHLGFDVLSRGFCLEGVVPCGDGVDDAFRHRATFHLALLRRGYGWSFPRGEGYAVGAGGAFAKGRGVDAAVDRLCRELPELGGRRPVHLRGGMIPDYRGRRKRYVDGNACLVGDAAGLVDPLTGEGIFYAVRSAQLAAEGILKNDLARYESALADELLPELDAARRLARRFRILPARLFGGVMRLRRFEQKARAFVDVLSGRCGYREAGLG